MEEGKREFLEVEVEGKKYLILDSGITDEDFVVPPASIINKVYVVNLEVFLFMIL